MLEMSGVDRKWCHQGRDGYPSMSMIYLHAMDALWPICPDCVFLVEGAQTLPVTFCSGLQCASCMHAS